MQLQLTATTKHAAADATTYTVQYATERTGAHARQRAVHRAVPASLAAQSTRTLLATGTQSTLTREVYECISRKADT